jgi:hypothetical protein
MAATSASRSASDPDRISTFAVMSLTDIQVTPGCPTLDTRTSILVLRVQGAMLPYGLLRPFPEGPGCPPWCPPRMRCMLDNRCFHQKFIAILLLPLEELAIWTR